MCSALEAARARNGVTPEGTPARGRPFFTIPGIVSLLDRTPDQVLGMIAETGELLYAFDLSLVPERATRKELRVLPQCVEDFRAGRKCRLGWKDVARLATPHDNPILTGVEIQRTLNVSGSHVTALLRRDLLKSVGKWGPGPTGSPRIPASSFLEFLERRRFF